jgi:hypothetical protein
MANQFSAKLENGVLVISIPIESKPFPASSTGKSFAVASTYGPVATAIVVDGKPLVINVNAYIKNSNPPAAQEA